MFKKLKESLKSVDMDKRKSETLLGEILVISHKCTHDQVRLALKKQGKEEKGRKIGDLLNEFYKIKIEDIKEALEVQRYLREDLCSTECIKKFENAARNFSMQKEIFKESLDDIQSTLKKANVLLDA